MAFVSKNQKAKSNKPDYQLVIKVPTSKGHITLGKVGLYQESALHSKVIELNAEQLLKLLAKAELSIVAYSEGSTEEGVELLID